MARMSEYTEEQWECMMIRHLARSGRNVGSLIAAKQFTDSIKRLQVLGPIDSITLEEMQAQLLVMGEPQEPLKSEEEEF
jgi:hypothetical protein